MRDLSLHILDLIENSLRAGATVVSVGVQVDLEKNIFTLTVDDNGRGFSAPPECLTDPFYTTKSGKSGGLGLSLLKAACEQAGGSLTIGVSPFGGARIRSTMQHLHIDRRPLGDLAGTFFSAALANPEVDFRLRLEAGVERITLSVFDGDETAGGSGQTRIEFAQRFAEKIKNQLANFGDFF